MTETNPGQVFSGFFSKKVDTLQLVENRQCVEKYIEEPDNSLLPFSCDGLTFLSDTLHHVLQYDSSPPPPL